MRARDLVALEDFDLAEGMCGRRGALKCSEGARVRCERSGICEEALREAVRWVAIAARDEVAEGLAAGVWVGRYGEVVEEPEAVEWQQPYWV